MANMPARTRIAVVFGGRSSEHSISVVSAASVVAALDPQRYEVITIGITRDGAWVRTGQVPPPELAAGNLPEVSVNTSQVTRRTPGGAVAVFDPESGLAALDDVDVVFPVLHGPFGEDGTIQGLLEMADIPYVGSGVLASAASMDKAVTKTLLRAAGLDVGEYLVLGKGEAVPAGIAELGLPVFVKPARGGSSIGISKVSAASDLAEAVATAFRYDSKVLVEAAVTGREIECGVLEDADGTVTASLPAEIRLHEGFDWYSFQAKYLEESGEFDIPPNLAAGLISRVQANAVTVFRTLECSGLARVDFFVRDDASIVVNEINTMPGFTPISMYARMWAETGVTYAELVDRLVATALTRSGRMDNIGH